MRAVDQLTAKAMAYAETASQMLSPVDSLQELANGYVALFVDGQAMGLGRELIEQARHGMLQRYAMKAGLISVWALKARR